MDLNLAHLPLDPVHLQPHHLREAHSLLLKPELQSLLSLLAMNSLLKNQTHASLTPEQAYYFNRAVLTFLEDIRTYQPPIIED